MKTVSLVHDACNRHHVLNFPHIVPLEIKFVSVGTMNNVVGYARRNFKLHDVEALEHDVSFITA